MCFCVAFCSVIVSVVGSNDREAQLALSASAQSKHNDIVQVSAASPGTSVENIRLEQGFLYSF